MSQPVNLSVLLSAISKMFVAYMPQHTPVAVCEVIHDSGFVGPLVICSDPRWTSSYAAAQAAMVMRAVTTYDEAIKLLGSIGTFGIAIAPDIPAMQACPDVLGLTTAEYAILWTGTPNKPFCRVRLDDGTINYAPIGRVQELQMSVNIDIQHAIGVITNQYRGSTRWFNADQMSLACQSKFSYADMSTRPYQELCGCYIGVPEDGSFTPDEKHAIAQYPQCNPTCLQAAVPYAPGGSPIPCNQNVCIIDAVNVTGSETQVSQVCSQCAMPYKCVCYIHINGETLNNQTCNTVYIVDSQGQITKTIHNTGPPAGAGLKKGWKSMISSPVAIGSLIGCAALIAIIAMGVLLAQHLQGRTKRNSRSIPVAHREVLGYASTAK